MAAGFFFWVFIHPVWLHRSQVNIMQCSEQNRDWEEGREGGKGEVGLDCLCDAESEKQSGRG